MGLQLQSPQLESFVVAAIIAALLFADRLGGSDDVMRRFYQVSVSFALVFAVFAATTVILPAPDLTSLVELDEPDFTESSERAKEVATIHMAVAFALLLGGLTQLSRYRTVAPGVVLGGLLLLLSSGDTGSGSDPASALGSLYGLFGQGDSDQTRDIIYLAVLLAGVALLLWYGVRRWEQEPTVEASG